MDSRVAIAKGIADLDCSAQIKACLGSMFNRELISSLGNPVTITTYSNEVDIHFENWDPAEDEVIE